MIWLILLTLGLLTALILVSPLLPAKASHDAHLQTSKGIISKEASKKKSLLITMFMGGFMFASLGIYALIGTPMVPIQSAFETAPETVSAEQVTEVDIQAMVDGLATRLAEDPENIDGWIRLLRSRIVMGQVKELIEDHKTMAEHFKTRPEVVAKINQQSGLNDLTDKVLGN